MKATILSSAFLLISAGQLLAADGNIAVSNRSIYDQNSGEVYNVPIWVDLNANGVFDDGEGIGTYAAAIGQPANFALFVQDNPTPIATSIFRSDIYGAFLGSPFFQTVFVPGYGPGERAPLRIKVWVGASFDSAAVRGSWDFLSLPLGGTPPAGLPIVPPGLDGWANRNGTGFALAVPPGPVAGADLITRASFSDARVSIATLLANDTDPNGGLVNFVGVDSVSNGGASISIANGEVVYHAANPAPDFFFYTVRNSAGGVSRGRVDVSILDPDGMIVFANQKIPMSGGSDFYETRIYVDADFDGGGSFDENFGDFATRYYSAPAKLGLFLKGSDTPLAVSSFGSGFAGFFLAAPASQTVVIPGVPPGAQADLTIKAWIGASFETSRVKGSWDITSRPLGGVVAGGQTFSIPGLTGWGNEFIASGYGLSPGAKPVVGADTVNRPYRANVTIDIATLLANDSDPEGGVVTFVSADGHSVAGAEISIAGSTITYKHYIDASDYFFYTVLTAYGAKAKCRVDVKMGDAIGEIAIANGQIPKPDGSGLYDVPVWVDINTNNVRDTFEGIGTYAANLRLNAYLGLSLQGSSEIFAKFRFSGDLNGAFLEAPGGTNVLVPGTTPGQRAQLTVKAWVGENFDDAKVKGSWDFTSLPLGGPRDGDSAVPTPALAGWGDESGAGFALPPGVIPAFQQIIFFPLPIRTITIPVGSLLPTDTNIGVIRFVSVYPLTLHGWDVSLDNNIVQVTGMEQNDAIAFSLATTTGALAMGRVDLQFTNGPAKIALANRFVPHSAGPGAYNIPIWIDANFNGRRDAGEGIGTFANQSGEIAQLGVFLPDSTTPLATARFHTDSAGAFLDEADFQDVVIPGAAPGSTLPLTLKAWIGENYDTASLKASWNFTPRELGGNALAGTFEIPGLSGWGEESNNAGYAIIPGAKPKTYGEVLTRQPDQNVNTKIADIIKNDVDPDGGALTFVSVDEYSREGAVVTVLGNTVYYIAPINDTGAPDYFEYTVRNSKGGIAKGRVDVVVTDAQGQFNTRLTIENFGDTNHISFRGVIGSNYLIQYRDTVEAPWQDLGPATHESFGLFSAQDANAAPSRFYRVQTASP
ncbi:MAG TPA: cadherin-like domain-containing protein [Verrucomicrobiae bacterium]